MRMDKNGCCLSSDGTLKLTLSEEWNDGIADVFHAHKDSHKLKADPKIFGVCMFKNECGQLGHGTPKLTVSQKWTDRINWFFACWYKVSKIDYIIFWVRVVKNGHVILVHETVQSSVS